MKVVYEVRDNAGRYDEQIGGYVRVVSEEDIEDEL